MEGMHTSSEVREEIRKMVAGREFQEERKEFSPLTGAYAERARKSGDEAWNLLAEKVVEFLPDLITSGIIHSSLPAIGEQEPCREAVRAQQKELLVRPGDRFPAVSFETFHPYLEFILRAGPVDLLTLKSRFRVEGKAALRDARILFSGNQVQTISGNILVAVKIYLCTTSHDVFLHQFDRPIHVE